MMTSLIVSIFLKNYVKMAKTCFVLETNLLTASKKSFQDLFQVFKGKITYSRIYIS